LSWCASRAPPSAPPLAPQTREGPPPLAPKPRAGPPLPPEQPRAAPSTWPTGRRRPSRSPYKQLDKNADKFAGQRVKFYGKIFQIQEDSVGGIMLLSVTDEGFDLWDDNVWVNYDHPIKSAEDDMVTVYGTVVGTKSYETQIGGETYVPDIDAKYIEG
jgi:hypothetical protein